MRDIVDLHTHTMASGDAYNTINEMIYAAVKEEIKVFGITEHGPAVKGSNSNIYFNNLWTLPREKMGITVLYGVELNILDFDGKVDLPENILAKMDVVIASMHSICIKSGSKEENTRAYLNVMKNPYVNIIGHPDDGHYPVDYKILAEGAKAHNVLLEVNNLSLNPKNVRENAEENYRKMLECCREFEIPIILGSDAHIEENVGIHSRAMNLLEEEKFPENLVVNANPELLKKYLNYYK